MSDSDFQQKMKRLLPDKYDEIEEMARLFVERVQADIAKDMIMPVPNTFNQAANELCTLQDAIYRDAKASNADMEQVEKLFALQWEQLMDDWSQVDE